MHKVNWLFVGILSFVLILILSGTGLVMSDSGSRDWGRMGPIGMMENWEYSAPPAPLSRAGMVFMGLIPVGLFVLAAVSAVWLMRRISHARPPSS